MPGLQSLSKSTESTTGGAAGWTQLWFMGLLITWVPREGAGLELVDSSLGKLTLGGLSIEATSFSQLLFHLQPA